MAAKLLLILLAIANVCQGAVNLTRATGLVHYPEPSDPGSVQGYMSQNPYHMSQNPARIRIALTRNISNLNMNRLMEPELSYYGIVGVGTPPKVFNVVFDTGTCESWLPYYNWFPLANNVHYSNGYSCHDTTTCRATKQEFTIDYRRTKLSGELYEDMLTLYQDMEKDDANLMVGQEISFEQNFLGVEDASDEQFRWKPYDGVIGLAPVTQSASGIRLLLLSLQKEQQQRLGQNMAIHSQGPSPVYDNQYHYRHNQIADLMFAFWFNPNQNSRHGGELMLGGVDENRYLGDIYYHRITSWFEWQLPLSNVALGGDMISCLSGCSVTLDTGANSLVGPRQDVEEIYEILKAHRDSDSGLWLVNCDLIDQYPTMVFRIEDTPYTLLPRHYIKLFRFQNKVVCHLAIKPWDNQGWLFGTSFIGAYYTVFDFANRRVGFATPRAQ